MTEPSGRVRVRRRVRIRRRRWLRWTLGTLGLLVALGGVALIPALGARARLAEARASMEEGRRAVLAGELEGASEAFADAESAFIRARGQAANPLLRAVSLLPLVGRNARTVEAMAEGGVLVARAGRLTATAVTGLPDGLGSLAPRRGRIAVGPLREIAGPSWRVSSSGRPRPSPTPSPRSSVPGARPGTRSCARCPCSRSWAAIRERWRPWPMRASSWPAPAGSR